MNIAPGFYQASGTSPPRLLRKAFAVAGITAALGLGLGACGSSGSAVNVAGLQASVASVASVVADGSTGPVSCSPEGNGSNTYLCLFNDGGPNSVVVTVFANGSWTSSKGVQGPAGIRSNNAGNGS